MAATIPPVRAAPIKVARVAWVTVALVVASIVSSSGAAGAAVAKPDVCALVTTADVVDAFGGPFVQSYSGGGDTSQCGWRLASANDVGSVVMFVDVYPNVEKAKAAYSRYVGLGHVSPARKVKGLGSQAAYNAPGKFGTVDHANRLTVRDGRVILRMSGGRHGQLDKEVPELDGRVAMIALARKALNKI